MWSKSMFTDPPTETTLDNGLIVSTENDREDGYDFFQAIVMDHSRNVIEKCQGHDYDEVYEKLVKFLETYCNPSKWKLFKSR
ncbi:hypothetical protein ASPCADRAFT_774 [Aspergillus carbonarius ITEM 5010]|uniref:Uncharacterized protein n=1 Tax=Aspergillus carbonarius (strain ITEM 5010) TaxID=602072 RepID=A0A1R3S2U5_ASPC5|nr:hypothetical protein ASPCADRAFT_774 [Aspergillus carbonarius ITEM 5010]